MKKETCIIAKRLWSLLLFCMLTLQITAQQTGTITGVITDTSGEPVIGASVLVNGTSNGTISDLNGAFTLTHVPNNGTITVSYIGYISQTISVNGKK
ncbi:MAG: carboxypeptidase-like regulatory domain-containing protein, partial [Bacteroides sp.]